jgi:hypothetical protein
VEPEQVPFGEDYGCSPRYSANLAAFYDYLIYELKRDDSRTLKKFHCMPTDMCDEIFEGVGINTLGTCSPWIKTSR